MYRNIFEAVHLINYISDTILSTGNREISEIDTILVLIRIYSLAGKTDLIVGCSPVYGSGGSTQVNTVKLKPKV